MECPGWDCHNWSQVSRYTALPLIVTSETRQPTIGLDCARVKTTSGDGQHWPQTCWDIALAFSALAKTYLSCWVHKPQKVYTFSLIRGNIIPKSLHFQFFLGNIIPKSVKCMRSATKIPTDHLLSPRRRGRSQRRLLEPAPDPHGPQAQGNESWNFQNRLPYKNLKSWKVEFTANKTSTLRLEGPCTHVLLFSGLHVVTA